MPEIPAAPPQTFAGYLDTVQDLLHDLGVPGILSAPTDVQRLEEFYDMGAPLEVVLRGVLVGTEKKIARGREVRRLGDLLPTIRAELRRSGATSPSPPTMNSEDLS